MRSVQMEKGKTMSDKKSCGNCVNCEKTESIGWVCEEYGFFHNGCAPVNCSPPYDEACELWTDDPKKKNNWEKFV